MPLNSACPRCGGKGEVATPNGNMWQVCPKCDGSGKDPGREVPFTYVWDPPFTSSQLTAGQVVIGTGPTMLGEADFVWKMTSGVSTGAFRWAKRFGGGGYFSSGGSGSSNDRVRNACNVGTAQFPFPEWPHIVIPRSGKILFDIEDLSLANNVIQLCFIGALLYPSVGG